MRGAALAFPNLCVGPPRRQGIAPTPVAFVIGLLNCVSKGGAAQPPRGLLRPVRPPLIPDMLWCPRVGSSHRASRVRIAAEQLQRPDRIYLLGNSSGDFTVAKGAPRSIKHFRENPWSNLWIASTSSRCDFIRSNQR